MVVVVVVFKQSLSDCFVGQLEQRLRAKSHFPNHACLVLKGRCWVFWGVSVFFSFGDCQYKAVIFSIPFCPSVVIVLSVQHCEKKKPCMCVFAVPPQPHQFYAHVF